MMETRLQYSLANLFVGTTVIAVLIAFTVYFRPAAVFAAIVISPIIFGVGMAFIAKHVPMLARVILFLIVGAFIFLSALAAFVAVVGTGD
jgi:hypothetical protein